jgi:hypothetical protein
MNPIPPEPDEPKVQPATETTAQPGINSEASSSAATVNPETNPGELRQKSVSESAPLSVAEEPAPPTVEELDQALLAQSAKQTRRAFVGAAFGAAAGYAFYRWIEQSRRIGDQPILLRRAFQANASVSRAVFDDRGLAPTYPLNRAENLRTNGVFGLQKQLVPGNWRLQLVGVADAPQRPGFVADVTAWKYQYVEHASNMPNGVPEKMNTVNSMAPKEMQQEMQARMQQDQLHTGRAPRGLDEAGESRSTLPPGTPGLLLTIDAIAGLPRHELVTQFKCIEGWSQIVHWAGVRMADFLEAYPPQKVNGREPRYVYMETPDGDYYTGYDMRACRHPQTLLVTEMMGAPLTQLHGAPLRLHMPIKYGYKQIKRIALIRYMDTKPDDYWTHLGYDWYGGL